MNSYSELNKPKAEFNRIKLEDIFKNIKSKYILQKIFNNLLKKKSLDIIKYNKNMKDRININIKDYKEYYEEIEIEIIPIKDKYGKFIYIKEKDKLYYHIYFNDKEEEIKINYIKENLILK